MRDPFHSRWVSAMKKEGLPLVARPRQVEAAWIVVLAWGLAIGIMLIVELATWLKP